MGQRDIQRNTFSRSPALSYLEYVFSRERNSEGKGATGQQFSVASNVGLYLRL